MAAKATATKRRSRAGRKQALDITTPERGQHNRIEAIPTDVAGVKARRVKPVVEMLSARGTIDGRQLAAAEAYREDYEVGVLGARTVEDMPVGVQTSKGDRDALTQRQIEAGARYQRVCRGIGLMAGAVVTDVVLLNLSLEHAGRKQGVDKKTVAGRLQVALDQVASFYGL